MANPAPDYVLGFLGNREVHKDNVRALLADQIAGHLAINKRAKVDFLLAVEDPLTETMDTVADMAVTSGYTLGFLAHSETYQTTEVEDYKDAVGDLAYVVDPEKWLGDAMVEVLAGWKAQGHNVVLILAADPDDDDEAYRAFLKAEDAEIMVLSMLQGLSEVKATDDEDEALDAEGEARANAAADDGEAEPEPPALDDPEDIGFDNPDETPDRPDEDADEVAALLETAEILSDPDTMAALAEADAELAGEPAAGPAVAVVEDAPREHPEVPDEDYLRALAAESKKDFYALCARYDVKPGRGIKIDTMVVKVLEATGQEPKGPESSIRANDIDPATRKDIQSFIRSAEAALRVAHDLLR